MKAESNHTTSILARYILGLTALTKLNRFSFRNFEN